MSHYFKFFFLLLVALFFSPTFSEEKLDSQNISPKIEEKVGTEIQPEKASYSEDTKHKACVEGCKTCKGDCKECGCETCKEHRAHSSCSKCKHKHGKHGKNKCESCKHKHGKHGKHKCESCKHKHAKHGKKCHRKYKKGCKKGGFFSRLFGSKKDKTCHFEKDKVTAFSKVKAVDSSSIKGEVFFNKVGKKRKDSGIEVKAKFTGLRPGKKYGFHVHEFGDCGNQAERAGAHFNPRGKSHGGAHGKNRHMGDLGNLVSNSKGEAMYYDVIRGYYKKFLGRSVVIHSDMDDEQSQPSGNSKDRIACGVIVSSPFNSPEFEGMPKNMPHSEKGKPKKKPKKRADDFSEFIY